MHEKERRSTVRRAGDKPRRMALDFWDAAGPTTTLWRMRSATYDNQASCSVTDMTEDGCDVLVVFTKGLGVPEHFDDVGAAMRHSMEIAGRLIAQGWIDVDLHDT